MTKVFVTVGTTRFSSLVRFFDQVAVGCDVVLQHAEPAFVPTHARGFAFAPSVREWHAWADVVVTHAGAGSVYDLLEQQRRIVVVPNLERADKHQLDLAGYVERQRYAMVVKQLSSYPSVPDLINAALRFDSVSYKKTAFFKADFLLGLLRDGNPPAAGR